MQPKTKVAAEAADTAASIAPNLPIQDEPEGTMLDRIEKAKAKESKKLSPPENKAAN